MKTIGQMEVKQRNKSYDKIQRLPFNVLKRVLIKSIDKKSSVRELNLGFPAIYKKEEEEAISVETMIVDIFWDIHVYGTMIAAANKLWAAGYEPNSFVINITVGNYVKERDMKSVLSSMSNIAKELNCRFSVGNANLSSEFQNQMIISIFTTGNKMKERRIFPFHKKAQILFVGYLAMEDTSLLSRVYKDELLKRIPSFMVETATEFGNKLKLAYVSHLIFKKGIIKALALGRGGIEAALYELADSMNIGFKVDMNSLPIRQETVEVCEILRKNLYELNSNGAMLIITQEAENLREYLLEHGIKAELIGEINCSDKAKKLIRGERVGYLERP